MPSTSQSTMINVKTILDVEEVHRKVMSLWPSCIFVGATHEDTDTKHCHCVVRFEVPTRWDRLESWLNTRDQCYYAKPARSWRRSVRYLLHLDNADKGRIPRAALVFDGIDEDELDQLLGSAKMKILDSLIVAQSMPLQDRFRYLVEVRGHLPSEVSAALRCLIDLEKWAESRHGQVSALPEFQAPVLSDEGLPEGIEDNPLLDDGGSFYD